MTNSFQIKAVTWTNHAPSLRLIREQVFIVEQHVPSAVEWDALDATAIHLLATDIDQRPIACARILKHGKIGRMGVLHQWRAQGVGSALLQHAIAICEQRNDKHITLSAQTHAIKFYQKHGFLITSEAYIDVNIWHVNMQLTL